MMKPGFEAVREACEETADRVLELHYEYANARAIGDVVGAIAILAAIRERVRRAIVACKTARDRENGC